MTTTPATQSPRSCRCGATIIRAGRSWIMTDETGRVDFHCPDGSIHAPACSPSVVHDVITTWTDSAGRLLVFPGDLVLVGRTLECVAAIAYDPPGDEAVRVDLEGWSVTHCESPGAYVAVRRYDTGEG